MSKEEMIIQKFDTYRDGGTIEIETNEGIFCFDNRINSITKGKLYNGYPKKDNSNLIENSEDLELKLIEGLEKYRDIIVEKQPFYQTSIDNFIKQN
jgi:hypothetical protein